MQPGLTIEEVKAALSYEKESGAFTWLVSKKGLHAGRVAGTICKNGYRHISINKHSVYAHRLAWFYVHGRWPAQALDHINGDRSDNRIANLREASQKQNMANRPANRGRVLPKGVHRHGQRWKTVIKYDGLTRHLGCFDTIEEASAAYAVTASRIFGEFARA